MTPEQAQAIYVAGEQAVVKHLCALDAQVQAGEQEIEALQRKLAQRSKNSSTSSKPPSSDDITKPNKGAGQAAEAQGKGNTSADNPVIATHPRTVSARDPRRRPRVRIRGLPALRRHGPLLA
jgi:hypothetical protein